MCENLFTLLYLFILEKFTFIRNDAFLEIILQNKKFCTLCHMKKYLFLQNVFVGIILLSLYSNGALFEI